MVTKASSSSSNLDATSTYRDVAAKAEGVRQLLLRRGLQLHPQSALASLFGGAEELANDWEVTKPLAGAHSLLIAAMHTNRVCNAVIGLANDEDAQECLHRISKRAMDLSTHAASQAKDALFELELLEYLRHHGMPLAKLGEPDDLIPMAWGSYPIACKKINSLSNVCKQIGSACGQLENFEGHGLIVLNLDVLVPENALLGAETFANSKQLLGGMMRGFLDENRTRIQEVAAAKRCDGFIFCITALANIAQATTHQNQQTEFLFWSLSDQHTEGAARFSIFASALYQSVGQTIPTSK